jgi:hypothetical protein
MPLLVQVNCDLIKINLIEELLEGLEVNINSAWPILAFFLHISMLFSIYTQPSKTQLKASFSSESLETRYSQQYSENQIANSAQYS